MTGVRLAGSEFKQIQSDLVAEFTADLSVNDLDLDFGSCADDGTVQMTAVYKAFFVTGCDVEMQINFAVFPCNSTCKRNDLISSLETERMIFFCYRVVNTCGKIIDRTNSCYR